MAPFLSRLVPLASAALLATACSSSSPPVAPDATTDTGTDAAADATLDATTDVGADARPDVAPDSSTACGPESAVGVSGSCIFSWHCAATGDDLSVICSTDDGGVGYACYCIDQTPDGRRHAVGSRFTMAQVCPAPGSMQAAVDAAHAHCGWDVYVGS